ncbi:hypothetical protein ACN38_g12963 [Penicillium nordicum]|uniref:Uncharacterized protein n=1 Tax=Penicillium nordicum TaxID=229535 RepID=A0A0M9W9F3_9EURO|nr:hypothetical protein ACN38_g12963 [Penicillium nordicum]
MLLCGSAVGPADSCRSTQNERPPPGSSHNPGSISLDTHTPRLRITLSLSPASLFLLSASARMFAWIKGVQWTWHCTPSGRHPSSSVTLF